MPSLPLAELLLGRSAREQLQQGWSPQCLATSAPDDTWGVLKTTAIQAGRFLPHENKELPASLEPRPALEVRPGDLLLTCAGPRSRCGVPALVRDTRARLMLSGKMYRFRPDPALLDPRYLELYLLSPDAQEQIEGMKTGISDSGLNLTKDRFLSLSVPVVPLPEQERIVEILEDHLSRLDAANDYLDAAHRRVERLAATEVWHLTHDVMGGATRRLDAIGEVRLGRQRSPANHQGMRMRPYLRAANVDWNRLRLEDIKEMNFTEAEEDTYRLQAGDILLVEASGSAAEAGKSVVYEGTPADVCFQNTLLRVRCTEEASPHFVQKYLLAEAMAGRFIEGSRGVGINHIGRAKLASLAVVLPTLAEQQQRAERCDRALEAAQALRKEVRSAQDRSTSLRRALLAAAFSGRLTGRSSGLELAEEMALA